MCSNLHTLVIKEHKKENIGNVMKLRDLFRPLAAVSSKAPPLSLYLRLTNAVFSQCLQDVAILSMELEYFAPLRELWHLRRLFLRGLRCSSAAVYSDLLVSLLPSLTMLTHLELVTIYEEEEEESGTAESNAIVLDMRSLSTTLESLIVRGNVALHAAPQTLTLPRLTELVSLTETEPASVCMPLISVCNLCFYSSFLSYVWSLYLIFFWLNFLIKTSKHLLYCYNIRYYSDPLP